MAKKLYQHQAAAKRKINQLKAASPRAKIKGRIIIPTGGGKTLIQIKELTANLTNGKRVHLVLAPRIALLNQLSREYRAEIGDKYLALAFHSGMTEPDSNETVNWLENSTTSSKTVVEDIARSKLMKKDLVIFSTYHSAHKLAELGINFNCGICDESQYCVQENFHLKIRELSVRKFWFFTATEKHTSSMEGNGLNNEEVFGKIVYQTTPEKLIKKGIIVPPRLHHAEVDGDNIVKEVIGITKIHAAENAKNKMPKTKVLYACNGTKNVKEIFKSVKTIQHELPEFDIFTITSSHGVWINSTEVDRTTFLAELDSCDNAIIAHYDILSEGIDIGGITGVVLMRNLTQSKLIQTIGRAVRRFFVNGKNIKKYALVTVITRNDIKDNYEYVNGIVNALRMGGYGINFEDILEISPGNGDDDPEIDDLYEDEDHRKNNSNITLRHFLENENMFDKLFDMLDSGANPKTFDLQL